MKSIVCTNCGHQGQSKTITQGSFVMEIFLWLCFLAPGFIYSVWRLTSKFQGCPICQSRSVIPSDSPNAQKFINQN